MMMMIIAIIIIIIISRAVSIKDQSGDCQVARVATKANLSARRAISISIFVIIAAFIIIVIIAIFGIIIIISTSAIVIMTDWC